MEFLREYYPILILILIGAYLWWMAKDRQRANTYQNETEQAKEYRAKSYEQMNMSNEHMARSREHMEKVEQSLERIATALEQRNKDESS